MTTLRQQKAAYREWKETFKPVKYVSVDEEDANLISKMNPRYVWTEHGTCEDNMVSNGYSIFNGHCCWETYGFWVCDVPWGGADDNYISYNTDFNTYCRSCNKGGRKEYGKDDCEVCDGEGYTTYDLS